MVAMASNVIVVEGPVLSFAMQIAKMARPLFFSFALGREKKGLVHRQYNFCSDFHPV